MFIIIYYNIFNNNNYYYFKNDDEEEDNDHGDGNDYEDDAQWEGRWPGRRVLGPAPPHCDFGKHHTVTWASQSCSR